IKRKRKKHWKRKCAGSALTPCISSNHVLWAELSKNAVLSQKNAVLSNGMQSDLKANITKHRFCELSVTLSRERNDISFKKYKCLTISEKQKVIEPVEKGERKVDVAKAFEIPLSMLSTILKNKEKIFSASSSKVRKRVSKGNFPRLEQCLVSWMKQCRGQNIPMDGSLLKKKPKAFAKELGIEF
ncbi:uncharacterized protein TNCV_620571, partial [Trichonephila clavipes]